MNYKKIIVGFALSLACLSVQQAGAETFSKSKKKENVTAATSINWADASGKVSYSINATTAPVVKIALKMFSNDMKAVTGNEAKEKAGANIQLNLLTNKEFSAVEKLGAPLHKFITAKDAFYIGTRKGKIIVIGSDARGTAYAIMELSRMAGVSPMAGWNDSHARDRIQRSCPERKQVDESEELQSAGATDAATESQHPLADGRQARGCLQQGGGR